MATMINYEQEKKFRNSALGWIQNCFLLFVHLKNRKQKFREDLKKSEKINYRRDSYIITGNTNQ